MFSPDDGASWKDAEAQPADRRGPRPRGQGRRPGGRHARPLALDPRRPHAAARVDDGDRGGGRRTSSGARRPCAGSYEPPVSSHVKGPGENPPAGAVVYYWLKDEPKGDVRLEILDEKGALVRTLSSREGRAGESPRTIPTRRSREPKPLPKEAGLQRAVWDLRYEGATKIKGAKIDSGDPGTGPLVLPGRYTLRLTRGRADAHDAARGAPRPARERAARRPRGAARLRARAARRPRRGSPAIVHEPARRCASRSQARVGARCAARPAPSRSSPRRDALAAQVRRARGQAPQPEGRGDYDILAMPGGAKLYSRLAPLYSWAHEGDGRPTQGMREVYARAAARARRARRGVEGDRRDATSPALNAKARELAPDFVVRRPLDSAAGAKHRPTSTAASERGGGCAQHPPKTTPSPGRGGRAPRAAPASARRRRRRGGAPGLGLGLR